MNDQELDKLLDKLKNAADVHIDPDVKQATIKQASAQFHQGINDTARPIDKSNLSIWSKLVNFITQPNQNRIGRHAFSTFAVIVVAVSVVLILPVSQKQQDLVLYETSPVTEKREQVTPAKTTQENTRLNSSATPQSNQDQSTGAKKVKIERRVGNATRLSATDSEAAVSPAAIPQETVPQKQRRSFSRESKIKPLPSSAVLAESALADQLPYHSPALPDSVFPQQRNRDEFAQFEPSTTQFVTDQPISTFSIDVDTASYSFTRNQLNNGHLPSPQAIRVEEFINYFDYNYPSPTNQSQPFKANIAVLDSPWNSGKKLIRIGVKGYEIDQQSQPDSNLVLLLDVSGSMNSANKLPLVKQSIKLLLETLKPTDTISIAVYAGAAGAVLQPTQVKHKGKILNAIANLHAGGSTAGGAGIQLAYQLAEQNFIKDGVNRIILATDGDFNVGLQSNDELKTLVERKRDKGVFLSVLGFGHGNYQDDMMQTLAQNGNGVAAYIDTLSEAKKVLVDEATSMLFPIAKDVKLQVEFNPATVSDYRLIGYETRALNKQDFNDDKVDAGDIGAGHTVTAIYEITPSDGKQKTVDAPRYVGNQISPTDTDDKNEYGFLKIRYKLPDQTHSRLIETPISVKNTAATLDDQFAIAVAGFGQLLANSKHTGELTYDDIIETANASKGEDEYGHRAEFIQLVRMAKIMTP